MTDLASKCVAACNALIRAAGCALALLFCIRSSSSVYNQQRYSMKSSEACSAVNLFFIESKLSDTRIKKESGLVEASGCV